MIETTPSSGLGSGRLAWESLSSAQQGFIKGLPKVEAHAHLNGCIPRDCLRELAHDYLSALPTFDTSSASTDVVRKTIEELERGVVLQELGDFFNLFPAVYKLTSTRSAVQRATHAVLSSFLSTSPPQCKYMELRTTPRKTADLTARDYVMAVLDVLESFGDRAALIVSVDRRMRLEEVDACIQLAAELKGNGRKVVGIDLCGDPLAGDMKQIAPFLATVRETGLKLTVHVAETAQNSEDDTLALLSCEPDRLGHATFLSSQAREVVLKKRIPIEICLSSNMLCQTVLNLQDHHVTFWLEHQHPIIICTDDTLPFRTCLWYEYALLLASPPLGLGLGENQMARIAHEGTLSTFAPQ